MARLECLLKTYLNRLHFSLAYTLTCTDNAPYIIEAGSWIPCYTSSSKLLITEISYLIFMLTNLPLAQSVTFLFIEISSCIKKKKKNYQPFDPIVFNDLLCDFFFFYKQTFLNLQTTLFGRHTRGPVWTLSPLEAISYVSW